MKLPWSKGGNLYENERFADLNTSVDRSGR